MSYIVVYRTLDGRSLALADGSLYVSDFHQARQFDSKESATEYIESDKNPLRHCEVV